MLDNEANSIILAEGTKTAKAVKKAMAKKPAAKKAVAKKAPAKKAAVKKAAVKKAAAKKAAKKVEAVESKEAKPKTVNKKAAAAKSPLYLAKDTYKKLIDGLMDQGLDHADAVETLKVGLREANGIPVPLALRNSTPIVEVAELPANDALVAEAA